MVGAMLSHTTPGLQGAEAMGFPRCMRCAIGYDMPQLRQPASSSGGGHQGGDGRRKSSCVAIYRSGQASTHHLRTDWLLMFTGGSALSMALLAPLTVSDRKLSPSSMLESLE